MRRLDSAQALAGGIAAVSALLVIGGLVLSALGALDATGWAALVLAVAVLVSVAIARDRSRVVPAFLAMTALGLAIGAVAVSRESARDHALKKRFTQLWLVERGSSGRAEIGVRNEEGRRVALRLQVFGPTPRGPGVLLDRTLTLGPSQTWSRQLAVSRTARPVRVNAELYRLGARESHRSAHLWTRPAPRP